MEEKSMTDFYELDPDAQQERMRRLALRALREWDLGAAELKLIKYRENAVFKVLTSGGALYALRIHRSGYHSDAELRSELQWIAALQQAGLDVPSVVSLKNGENFAVVTHEGIPEPRQVDMFEWVEGAQLGSVEEGVAVDPGEVRSVYKTIGALAAQLHNQAAAWALPKNFTRHAWDAEGLTGEQPFWGRFWELEALTTNERDLLLAARARVHEDLIRYGDAPENAGMYSLIHADFVAENLLIDGDRVRLIDFDDAGFGWHLFEIATALYFEMDEPHFETALEALLKGYRAHRPLSEHQVAQLPLFFMARAFTYLGWVHTRQETETAKEMTPMLVAKACRLAEDYLTY